MKAIEILLALVLLFFTATMLSSQMEAMPGDNAAQELTVEETAAPAPVMPTPTVRPTQGGENETSMMTDF